MITRQKLTEIQDSYNCIYGDDYVGELVWLRYMKKLGNNKIIKYIIEKQCTKEAALVIKRDYKRKYREELL